MGNDVHQFKTDFLIIEIGGTIGDIESLPFIEAIRQFKTEVGYGNAISIHCTLLPYLPTSGELKTKPSQHSVTTLRSYGLQPEILVCRTTRSIPKGEKEKLALAGNYNYAKLSEFDYVICDKENIIDNKTATNLKVIIK